MPIEVLTGQPGNGKTTRMMARLVEESKKEEGKGRRFLVAIGIEGLAPGLVDFELADGKRWNEVDRNSEGTCLCHDGTGQVLDLEQVPRKIRQGTAWVDNPVFQAQLEIGRPHAHVIPDGALIFVDEAWKWFGHMHDARQAATPLHVLALAEHRHRGLDFVMTTQMANQLYPFMRGLIGAHTNIVRQFGTSMCKLYTWPELNSDVGSQTQRERALSVPWTLPSSIYGNWKSASVHTIKRSIPWRIALIPICLVGALVLGLWVYSSMKGGKVTPGATAASGAPAAGAAAGGPATRERKPLTPGEWEERLRMRIPGVHGSQPVFDDRKVLSKPATYCVAAGEPHERTCNCYTEQATVIPHIGPAKCYAMARGGVYDPFREPMKGTAPSRVVGEVPPMVDGHLVDQPQEPVLSESFDEPIRIPGAIKWDLPPVAGGPR